MRAVSPRKKMLGVHGPRWPVTTLVACPHHVTVDVLLARHASCARHEMYREHDNTGVEIENSQQPGKHFSKGAVDSKQYEADILNPLFSRDRSSRRDITRQANIVIKVPPRPTDWWAWEELHSPLLEKLPGRPSVAPRRENLESKELPRQKRPRGRPRRNETRPSIQKHRSNSTPQR